jgi:hypothetical protein
MAKRIQKSTPDPGLKPNQIDNLSGEQTNRHMGEIVDVSTTRFTAQCLDRENPPHFGGFVKADGIKSNGKNTIVYGIIYNAHEASVDPARRPVAHGLTPDELHRRYPHFEEYLKVELEAAVIGFSDGDAGIIHTYLPPFPPRIHSFIYRCDTAEVLGLTEDLEFIRTINSLGGLPVEELVAAAIRFAYIERGSNQSFLVRCGQEIAKLMKDDYEKARGILRRING